MIFFSYPSKFINISLGYQPTPHVCQIAIQSMYINNPERHKPSPHRYKPFPRCIIHPLDVLNMYSKFPYRYINLPPSPPTIPSSISTSRPPIYINHPPRQINHSPKEYEHPLRLSINPPPI